MEFLYEYGLFLAKSITLVLSVVAVLLAVAAVKGKTSKESGSIEIENLNETYDELESTLEEAVLDKESYKAKQKEKKQKEKQENKKQKKEKKDEQKPRVFVLHFDGDVKASEVEFLREEITAVLSIATPKDEVVVMLESAGGMVHNYGLAASQLQRIRDRNIPLTAIVDRVAASGGYMMACVANKIIAAPFAIIGSVGVIAQMPNFNRLLKKWDIDYEQVTAGKYKRTLTLFGENTNEAREKFQEEMEEVHVLFKDFVSNHRQVVDIEKIATGEHWYGKQALDLKLVDELSTSDDYLLDLHKKADIYSISYEIKESIGDKLQHFIQAQLMNLGIRPSNNIY